MSRFQIPKPKTVIFAVRAFWIGWMLSLPRLLMRLFLEKPEPDAAKFAVMGMMVAIPVVICLVFIPVWLFQNISLGKNWARLVWVVMVALSVPRDLVGVGEAFSAYLLSGLLGLTQWIFIIASCILLFIPSSTPWFRSRFDDAVGS